MLIAPLLALVITSPSAGAHALAEHSDAGPSSEHAQTEALRHLEAAQAARVEGRFEDAIESAQSAIDADPSYAGAYLMRTQVLFELLGDLEQLPTRSTDIDPRGPGWARQAAADIERYLELTGMQGEPKAGFEAQRDRLLEAAAALEEALAGNSEGDEQQDEERDEEQDDGSDEHPGEHVPAPADRLGLGLMLGGSGLAAVGVGLLSGGVRMEPQCMGSNCVDAKWRARVPLLAPGVIASIGGASLVTVGAVRLARRGHSSSRRRRIIGGLLLASAGVAAIGSAVLGGVAVRRFDGADFNAKDELSTTQSLANAAVAIGSTVPSLLGGGIGLMLRPRRGPVGSLGELQKISLIGPST